VVFAVKPLIDSIDQPVVSDQTPFQLPPVAVLRAPITVVPVQVWPSGAPAGATGAVGSVTDVFGTRICPGISMRMETLVAYAGAAPSSADTAHARTATDLKRRASPVLSDG
jgi:hypothetical protein